MTKPNEKQVERALNIFNTVDGLSKQGSINYIAQAIADAVAEERESCAKVAESHRGEDCLTIDKMISFAYSPEISIARKIRERK